jgi:hypothetical protein
MNRLRIAIDPQLTREHGPEVHWTWRLLLTGMGWPWEQVPVDNDCDVAFVTDPSHAPRARLCILADARAWSRPAAFRLSRLGRQDGLAYPLFGAQTEIPAPVQTRDSQMICRCDLIFDVYWLVTGQEERYWPRDKHGFFDLAGTPMLEEQIPRQALASHIGIWLRKKLLDLNCPPPVSRWPLGKKAAASISHDVDYPEVKRWLEPIRVVARQGITGLGPAMDVLAGRRDHWHFREWVDLDTSLQTRPAFYFVARQGSLREYATGTPDPFYDITSERFRQLFGRLKQSGCEIGLQASYLAYKSREKFAAEKERLEEASGQPVIGNRHHYWHLNPDDVEETLLLHEQVGLKYDASLLHNHYVGWRRGLSQPFFPFHQVERRELKTLQLPGAWMDDQLFSLHEHNPGNGLEILRTLADRAVEQEGYLLVDLHDYVFDDTLFPGWTQTYHRLWDNLRARGTFWFATPAEVAEHWSARYTTLLQESEGLREGLS